MSARYANLGMRTASRQFALESGSAPSAFERRLRDIESGVAALNLVPESVHLAAEIAALESNLDDDRRIALILLIVVSLAALEEGSTRFPVTGDNSVAAMRRLLEPLCGAAFGVNGTEVMRLAIEDLVASARASDVIGIHATDYKPLLYLRPFIYQQRIHTAESALAKRLGTLIAAKNQVAVANLNPSDLIRQLSRPSKAAHARSLHLSDEQRNAVASVLDARLTIVSGGPGTGKTSIVMTMLRLLVRSGVAAKDIALAAPTGKAAYRIGEAIREGLAQIDDPELFDRGLSGDPPEPTTLHRLLGYSPTLRRFRHHHNNQLSASVVIVDEASMIDLALMARLLDALRDDARLVLLGDADQLPSVAAGAVFRDMLLAVDDVPGPRFGAVRLTRSYRTETRESGDSAILQLANNINRGDASGFVAGEDHRDSIPSRRKSPDEIHFIGAEWLDEPAGKYGAFLDKWYAEKIHLDEEARALLEQVYTVSENGFSDADCASLRNLFNRSIRSRILCVTRVFDSGTERINSRLHRRAAHDAKLSPDRNPFLAGEPVMMLRNDYDRGLFNGDQGLIVNVRTQNGSATPMAIFQRKDNFTAYRVDALKENLELCYAMTVHKAQGSEFDTVAVIMPETDIPILTREIVYTAVSRARRSVTVVGAGAIIGAGISRRVERYSGVREKLSQLLNGSRG